MQNGPFDKVRKNNSYSQDGFSSGVWSGVSDKMFLYFGLIGSIVMLFYQFPMTLAYLNPLTTIDDLWIAFHFQNILLTIYAIFVGIGLMGVFLNQGKAYAPIPIILMLFFPIQVIYLSTVLSFFAYAAISSVAFLMIWIIIALLLWMSRTDSVDEKTTSLATLGATLRPALPIVGSVILSLFPMFWDDILITALPNLIPAVITGLIFIEFFLVELRIIRKY